MLNDIAPRDKKECYHFNYVANNAKEPQYAFCSSCGAIGIKKKSENNQYHFITKPLSYENMVDCDPVEIALKMKDFSHYSSNSQKNKKRIITNWYKKRRNRILTYLKYLTKKLKYSECTFYKSLYFIDIFLNIEDDEGNNISNLQVEYIILSFFLIVSKFYENDILEPDLNRFKHVNEKNNFSVEEICHQEIKALEKLNYDLVAYSVYDWINLFMTNGFIFKREIIIKNNISISKIYSFLKDQMSLIIERDFLFGYSPIEIALSLIMYTRENFGLINNKPLEKLLQLYSLSIADFEGCYNDLYEVKDNIKANTINEFTSLESISPYLNENQVIKKSKLAIDCKGYYNDNKGIENRKKDCDRNYKDKHQILNSLYSVKYQIDSIEKKSQSSKMVSIYSFFPKDERERERDSEKKIKNICVNNIDLISKESSLDVNIVRNRRYCPSLKKNNCGELRTTTESKKQNNKISTISNSNNFSIVNNLIKKNGNPKQRMVKLRINE